MGDEPQAEPRAVQPWALGAGTMIALSLMRIDYDSMTSLREDPRSETLVVTFIAASHAEVQAKLLSFMANEFVIPRMYVGGDALYPRFRLVEIEGR